MLAPQCPAGVMDIVLHPSQLYLQTHENGHGPVQDVCLGFCYGPVAALGFWYPNQPCFKLTSGSTECR